MEAYGTIDELNSIVGIVRTYLPHYKRRFGNEYKWYSEILRRIQNELFDVGSELATPPPTPNTRGCTRWARRKSKMLEEEMDRMQQELKPLNSFTLAGRRRCSMPSCIRRAPCAGGPSASVGRCKRDEPINDHLMAYVNRLSDHLFVQSRWVAKRLEGAGVPVGSRLANRSARGG